MLEIYTLKSKACSEIYQYIDKNIKQLPKNEKGAFDEFTNDFIDNDVDALRHAYVSGAYTMTFGDKTAEILCTSLEGVSANVKY